MNKLLTIILTTSLLSGCFPHSNQAGFVEEEVTVVIENLEARNPNAYYIETPHATEGYYNLNTTPEIYAIVATRAINRMLDDTKELYETRKVPLIYIMEPKKGEETENGFYLSQIVTKKIIEGSRTYTVVNNLNDADYYLETLITKISFEDSDSSLIQYKISMYDRNDRKVGEWMETIRRTVNDDGSWL